MTSVLRLSALRERLRASLWFWPAVSVTVAVVAGVVIPVLEAGGTGDALGFGGTPEGARSVLAAVAGSMITVTGLTFSLTVLALQMASSQFTPRLLRTFLSDGGNQAVLSTFLSTFAYTLSVLRSVRSAVGDDEGFVPDIAVSIGLALTLLSVAMLVYFFHHLTQQLRVETVLREVTHDAIDLIERLFDRVDEGDPAQSEPSVPDHAVAVPARRTGYLQAVDTGTLEGLAARRGVSLRLRPLVGTHVTTCSTIAWAWRHHPQATEPIDVEQLSGDLHQGIHIGSERTLQQDVAFGLRQLVDIAARALSPGVNDPTTAVAVIHAMAAVTAALCGRRLGTSVTGDPDGTQVVLPRPSFAELLALACDQPRRYGRDEPAVLAELLRLLTDLGETCQTEDERSAIGEQIDITTDVADEARLTPQERARVRSLAQQARTALETGGRSPNLEEDVDEPAS